jgi:hypothetical protein
MGGVRRNKKRDPRKPKYPKPEFHRLLYGATVKTLTCGTLATGGQELFRAKTYSECWSYLRRLVDIGAVPFATCQDALQCGYAIDPPPMSPENTQQGGWR